MCSCSCPGLQLSETGEPLNEATILWCCQQHLPLCPQLSQPHTKAVHCMLPWWPRVINPEGTVLPAPSIHPLWHGHYLTRGHASSSTPGHPVKERYRGLFAQGFRDLQLPVRPLLGRCCCLLICPVDYWLQYSSVAEEWEDRSMLWSGGFPNCSPKQPPSITMGSPCPLMLTFTISPGSSSARLDWDSPFHASPALPLSPNATAHVLHTTAPPPLLQGWCQKVEAAFWDSTRAGTLT